VKLGRASSLRAAPSAASLSRARRAAFTIVEILVAMMILLIGMSAILGLLSFGAAMTRAAQLRTAASASVEAVVADLEETLFPITRDPTTGDWSVGEPPEITDHPVAGYPGVTYTAKAKPDPTEIGGPDGALRYDVTVDMHWTAGGQTRSKTFHTLLLRQVPFGERLRREFIEHRVDAPAAPPAAPPATGDHKP
jgi:type II secretory pathway pseudopilin PulG